MFTGDYGFFDYKYNIPGYSGQDFGGPGQYIYLAVSVAALVGLLAALHRIPQDRVNRIIGALGIFLTLLYIAKTGWETYYDVQRFGAFNKGLLPLDTCSIIMPAGILAGFAKGKLQQMAKCWVATGGIVGGLANLLFLNGLKYYPFLSFGALYSMLWHFLMVFMGLLVIVTERDRVSFSMVTYGFLLHLIVSAFVIPFDFLRGFDFMLYRDLGGMPFFEDVAAKLTESGMQYLNPALMLALYFAAFTIIWLLAAGIKNRKKAPAPAA
ncbi:MAG: YwaF family protein [Oscillospiraceae bacterium]|nr:YwaF family protein [Oscillospiraceae bacterium]